MTIGIILFLISVNVSGSFVKDVVDASNVSFDGNTLYVGGSGPGNYTKIQDAVNDSWNSDTVFVYNGIYYEYNISIDKSISLIGEDRETTIIYGVNTSSVVIIESNLTKIAGFTITNGWSGIHIKPGFSFISISNSIITYNQYGIGGSVILGRKILKLYVIAGNYINISDNIISNNTYGAHLCLQNSIFSNNICVDNEEGIGLEYAVNSTFSYNIISRNSIGMMSATPSCKCDIIQNNFSENNFTGLLLDGTNNNIIKNNFINNSENAFFIRLYVFDINMRRYFDEYKILSKNTWDSNYWDDYNGEGFYRINRLLFIIPWFNFDRNPALEPYDI